MRRRIRSGANSSVSEEATPSIHGLVRQNVTYASVANRTPGSTCRSSSISSRGTPTASPSLIHISMPPVAWLGAVVIDDPLQPLASHIGIGTVGDDRRVLAWDRALIREPIRHPSLELPPREPTFVHQRVEGMIRVIGPAERAQRGRERRPARAARSALGMTAAEVPKARTRAESS